MGLFQLGVGQTATLLSIQKKKYKTYRFGRREQVEAMVETRVLDWNLIATIIK